MQQILSAESHHLFTAFPGNKPADDWSTEQQRYRADEHPIHTFQQQPCSETLPNPFRPFGTKVLGREGGNGLPDALLRREGKIVHTGAGVEGGNHIQPQLIHLPLNQQLADGLNSLLQSSHTAVLQGSLQQRRINPPFAPLQAKHGHLLADIQPAHCSRGRFRNHRGQGRTNNAKTQQTNKNQVQYPVQNGRKHKKFQGCFAVAYAFQGSGQRIIEAGEWSTEKGDAQINPGHGSDFFRNGQQGQNAIRH